MAVFSLKIDTAECPKPRFYDCGICGAYHSAEWNGDCREDAARLDPNDLDEKYGIDGWEEIDMSDLPGHAEAE